MDDTNVQTDAPLQSDQIETKTEEKQDASDRLTPDHPRFKEVYNEAKEAKEENKVLKLKLDELEQKVNQRTSSGDSDEFTPEEMETFNRIEKKLVQNGTLATREDLNVERRALEYDRLSGKHDGSDDLPKFIPVEVEAYAKANGFSNLEKAYRDMHFDAFVQHEAKNRGTVINPPNSEKPTGSGGASTVADNSIEALVKKAEDGTLTDSEYAKHSDEIHAYMKNSAKSANIE